MVHLISRDPLRGCRLTTLGGSGSDPCLRGHVGVDAWELKEGHRFGPWGIVKVLFPKNLAYLEDHPRKFGSMVRINGL